MLINAEKFQRIQKKYEEKPEILREVNKEIFADIRNIELFANTLFPHHCKLATPDFHKEIIELIQQSGNKGIAAPRGHAKSTLIDLIYLSWLILNNKKHFIILISDTYTQAVNFLETLKDELDNNELIKWIYGDLKSADHWQVGDIETNTGIKVIARGVGMKIRGLKYKQYRPELILIDDLENDENIKSLEQREKLKRWFTNAVIPALSRDGEIVMIGTILHGDSLLNNIISNNGEFSSWVTKKYQAITGGKSLWPEMYTISELHRMKTDPTYEKYIGTIVFNQEYQNEPYDEADAIIKRNWVKTRETMPSRIVRSILIIDPAISKKDTADYTAKILMTLYEEEQENKTLKNKVVVRYIGNDRMGFSENCEDIKRLYEQYKIDEIGIETISFQEAFVDSLENLPILEIEPDKDKIRRTMVASKYFEGGQVEIMSEINNIDILIDQLTHFPSVKHDDLVDAVVYGVMILLGQGYGTYGSYDPSQDEEKVRPITAGLRNKKF